MCRVADNVKTRKPNFDAALAARRELGVAYTRKKRDIPAWANATTEVGYTALGISLSQPSERIPVTQATPKWFYLWPLYTDALFAALLVCIRNRVAPAREGSEKFEIKGTKRQLPTARPCRQETAVDDVSRSPVTAGCCAAEVAGSPAAGRSTRAAQKTGSPWETVSHETGRSPMLERVPLLRRSRSQTCLCRCENLIQ